MSFASTANTHSLQSRFLRSTSTRDAIKEITKPAVCSLRNRAEIFLEMKSAKGRGDELSERRGMSAFVQETNFVHQKLSCTSLSICFPSKIQKTMFEYTYEILKSKAANFVSQLRIHSDFFDVNKIGF